MDEFNVVLGPTKIDDDTSLVTSTKELDSIEDIENEIMLSTIRNYNGRKISTSSTYINQNERQDTKLTLQAIDALSIGINSDVHKVKEANSLVLSRIHSNGLFGRFMEIIEENIPTTYKLDYGELESDTSRAAEFKNVRFLIDSFNRDVNIERVIHDSVSGVIREGNYSMYCRMSNGNSAIIDHYPLDIVTPSGYKTRGNDVLEFDIAALRSKLYKPHKRTRKGKKIYFENQKKEIKANYPAEVYTAYNGGESICRLSDKYSAFIKIGDMDRRFGVSALFKALKPLIVLENLMAADVSDSQARAKKIIFQKMRKELLDGGRKGIAEQIHAHAEAASALQTNNCLYTGIPGVEDLSYITPKSTETDYKEIHEIYTQEVLRALGLTFIDPGATTSVAKVNLSLVLRLINTATRKLNSAIEHFYEALLVDNGYDRDLCPKFAISDAEQNELSIRKDLADFMFNTLGCSYETAYKMLDIDVKSEAERRRSEYAEGYAEVFAPRQTAYTYSPSSDDDGGRPPDSEDKDKQAYDKENYES